MTRLESGILPFTKSSCLTLEDSDVEVACEPYRAHWNELADRSIQITKIERDDARYGKPTLWVVDVLSRLEVDALENLIQRQLRTERVSRPYTERDLADELWKQRA